MAPILWFMLGGAAGAFVGSRVTGVVCAAVGVAGAGVAAAGVAAIRKKLSPQAQAEFDAAFAGLTPEEVDAVLRSYDHDPDAARVVQIVRQHWQNRQQWTLWAQRVQQSQHAQQLAASHFFTTDAGAPVAAAGAMWGQYAWQ